MEPMKGHESSDDGRPVRPGFKAPIPLDIRSGEAAKTPRRSLSDQLSGPSKESASERPKVIEEGLLFERPAAEDKLQPKPEAQPTVTGSPEVANNEAVKEDEPRQDEFDQEVERQIAAEVAAEQPVIQSANATEAAATAQQDMLDTIHDKASDINTDASAETIVNQSFDQVAVERPAQAATEQQPEVQTEPIAATELEPVDAARRATEAAYADQISPQPTPEYVPASSSQPSFEGAVPVPPTQAAAQRPPQPQIYTGRSSWFDRMRGRQEGKQAAGQEYRSQLRSKDSLINKFKKLINQRQRQINQQVAPPQPTGAEAAPASLPNRREPMTMPLPPEAAPTQTVTHTEVAPAQPQKAMPANLSPFSNERPTFTAEIVPVQRAEQPQTETINRPPTTSEQIPAAELVKIAERIYVDGVTVKSMFEVGRFDEDSLRRIVDGYLHGRNTAQIVNAEVQRHDRERFNRFETLNQVPQAGATAQYGPIAGPAGSQPIVHGSLPQPVNPYATSPSQANGVNPNQSQPTAANANSSVAERIVLGVSIFFIVVAAVILIGLFTRG